MSRSTTLLHVSEDDALVLVVLCEAGSFTIPLPPGQALTVGRDEECDVVVDDGSVSRKHASIGGEPLRVEDLGSRNGTRLFGERLEAGVPVALPIGASLELGTATVLLQRGGKAMVDFFGAAPRKAAHDLIVVDVRSQRVLNLAEVVAVRPVNVAILGEPGTGKKTLARFIKERGARAAAPLEELACTEEIDEPTIEAALTRATNGTLLLDAVERLTSAMQMAVVRVCERNTSTSAPRLLATLDDTKQGFVRPELMRLLAGFSLRIPPLRERVADIQPLAERFAGAGVGFTRAAIAKLAAHSWPRNAAELERAVAGAALAASGQPIDELHLDLVGIGGTGGALKPAVEEVERQRVLDALARAGGNQTQAAKILGVARGTLIARMEQYGVSRPRKELKRSQE